MLLAFLPTGESELARVPGLSVGIMSATQGGYSAEQMLLDITQGARVANSSYSRVRPPALSLRALGSEGMLVGWQATRRRAGGAPQLLRPGLLASQIPGGAAYVGVSGIRDTDAIAAADRDGRVSTVSSGEASSLLVRVRGLLRSKRLVVADLPGGPAGYEDLRRLSAARAPAQLLLVVQRTQDASAHELLWTAAAGLGGGAGPMTLSSQTTNQRGLVASVDITSTILGHLGLRAPADVRGEPIRVDGALDSAGLRALMARLHVIGPRRLPAFGWLLVALATLLLISAPWPRTRAWAMRIGGLGVLWAPVAVLIAAALRPSAAVEYLTIVLACLTLGALSDLVVPWPRAPVLAALTVILALSVDALAGTQLLMRSVLGPNPILGARFYGIGNELKSGLAVLVFAAVAGASYPGGRGRRAAYTMAGAGIVLALVEGSARIGAGVGGVILVSAGTAFATVLLLSGVQSGRLAFSRRALGVVCAPILGLIVLAAVDLATAHGAGHYTGSILHARSLGDLRDVIVRRYGAAWGELGNHAMPFATALALLCIIVSVRRGERLLAPVADDPVWRAALAGGLIAGVVGALVEDSGPVLLVVAVFTLGCVLSYLWGKPPDGARSVSLSDRQPSADTVTTDARRDPRLSRTEAQ